MQHRKKVQFLTFSEHVRKRSMWLGSSIVSNNLYWVRCKENEKDIFKKKEIEISEALLKCFDEILVNAIDQYINTINYSEGMGGPVSFIKASYDVPTGMITITNSGQGMPVYMCDEIGKYSVEGLITREYAGTNFDDDNDPDRVTGGINGLGIKLVNINCTHFEIETVDYIEHKYYHQICKDNMNIIQSPVIIDLKDKTESKRLNYTQRSPHTTIKFIPDYAALCKSATNKPDPSWRNPENTINFSKIIEYRMYQTAAFISSINYRYDRHKRIEYNSKAIVYFNGSEIHIPNLGGFIKMFGVENFVCLALEQSREEFNKQFEEEENDQTFIKFPWYLAIGFKNQKKFDKVSILNGVSLEKGGTHCDMILNQILDALSPRIKRISQGSTIELGDTVLRNLLFIIDCKQIPVPQFVGQTKESVKVGANDLKEMKKTFIVPKKIIDKVWKMIKDVVEVILSKREIAEDKKKRKKSVPIRKYVTADKLGSESMCFVPEGDSAAKMIRDMIHAKTSPLNYRKCGMYNIQGVPMNARKKIKRIIIDGKVQIKKHKTLMSNIGLQGLVSVFGLDYNEDYYFGPPELDPDADNLDEEGLAKLYKKRDRGDIMFKKLPYGKGIIIATDQDSDGIGHICSLILVFIMCFWPELIKRGYVKRLATPIIRVYHNKEVNNFYSEKEFSQWANDQFGCEANIPSGYEVNYYKGLAGHTEEEVLHDIGANLLENIYTFTWDDACMATMELFYGPETKGRKSVLITPVDKEYDANAFLRQEISCSDHFNIEAKTFQLKFMRRKLKNAIDGLLPSQRKAIAGARKIAKKGKIKVYQLTGYVTKAMGYQHGETAMNDAIIKMAQTFTGSNNIPPFVPISNGFGDRVNGRGEAGSPRYIDTKYNNKVMDLLFPREDDFLLNYEYEDGKQCEPSYYIPILPYSILETSTTAGVGWKISCWARDIKWTIMNLKRMIKGLEPLSFQGKVWIPNDMSVEIGKYPGGRAASEICFGSYTYNEDSNEIMISQLPLKVWSFNLECKVLGKDPKSGKTEDKHGIPNPRKTLASNFSDHTANNKNHVTIKLREGAIETLEREYGNEHITCIEHYFELTQQMLPQLNMIVADGSIREFSSYEDVMKEWFPLRKKLYKIRLERKIILLKLKIEFYQNEQRFIKMDSTKEINIDKDFSEEEREEILNRNGFVKFNKKVLFYPQYIEVKKLEQSIKGEGASYDFIDDITIRMKSKKAMIALEEKLFELIKELEGLEKQTWQTQWLNEIDNIVSIIAEGQKTGWLFGKRQHTYKKYTPRKK
jgi:DNA topoisomerase-2